MVLRGIRFSPVFNASGARGFYGEGYWYTHHWLWRTLGLDWSNTTFISKTTTLNPREGNMPLVADFTPRERRPRCIVVNPWNGHTVNAVGLSGPGAGALLSSDRPDRWQLNTAPILISLMALDDPTVSHMDQVRGFRDIIFERKSGFRSRFGAQLNRSCPNVEHAADTIEETHAMLDILGELGIPIVVKFNPVESVEFIVKTAEHPACDAIANGNTIPWGHPAISMDRWARIFGSYESPLIHRGFQQPGGLSGPVCLPISLDQIKRLRAEGVAKPIIGGNGIQSYRDVARMRSAGASGIELGTIALVRPWGMVEVINLANRAFREFEPESEPDPGQSGLLQDPLTPS